MTTLTTDEVSKPKITVKQFHFWLKGVIDMQPDNWVPDQKQWNKILEKIYEIDDSIEQERPVQYNAPTVLYRDVPMASHYAPEDPRTPMHQPPIQPLGPTSLNNVPRPMTSSGSSLLANSDGQIPVRTPNVDGNYDTPFV